VAPARAIRKIARMIKGMHGLFYSGEAEALRAFFRDKLRFPHSDVGEGWLIFDAPEADFGVHPLGYEGAPPANTHAISFYCDDVEKTVAELKGRGVEFTKPVEDHGYGLVTYFKAPGNATFQLYQPKYEKKRSK
jgi:predicted enzyme related to lactoylglutathione lyase